MTPSDPSSAKSVMEIVKELLAMYEALYPLRELNEYERELNKKYHRDVCMNFPSIARSLEECEEALEKISKPDIREIKPREDGGYSVMTVEYASWEREIAKQALTRLHSPIE